MAPKSDKRDPEIQRLTAENSELRKQVALLANLGRRVTASLDLPTVLADVVGAACELTGARFGALGVFDSSGKILQFMTHGLSDEHRKRIGALPTGKGVLGFLQQVQEPLRLADLSKHPRSVGFPKNHPPMHNFLGAPIRLGDEALGNIYLTEKEGSEEFTTVDQELLVLFAAQAALAIRNARLHQGVEAERTQLRTLIQTSPVGVGVFDAKTKRITEANHELARLFGAVEPSVIESLNQQMRVAQYLRPDGRAVTTNEEWPQMRAVLRGERVQAEEIRIELPGGGGVPTLFSATPIFDAEGNISAAITVVQDITPLEEIERLRSEFLGIVSHELKTPLTAIKGSAATALGSKRPLESDETEELFKIIDEQADRLRDMVDNLLDMTRIEAGRLSVNPESHDLRKILEEGINTFRRTGTGHEVQLQFPAGLAPVKVDRRRIVQVVTNLLSNAAKFAPSGIPIVIGAEPGAHQVTVRVRDQGRGIAAESLPHLFKKYSQVHADSGTKLMGTGLGLAICKGLVEAHGGRIWAESAGEGKGSTFSFTLNVSAEAPVERASRPAATTRQAEHRGSVTKTATRTRIMAVDDDGAILRFLQRTLDEAGYHPVATSNPADVVALVEREEPALLLLDVNLPGTSGYDLLKRVREFSGVPVIFLTARGDDADVVKALRMGADDYMTKPFSPSELLARIEATLRRRVLSDTLEVLPPYAADGLSINFAERLVTREGQQVTLSATEYKLLYELATHAGRVLTHEQILQRVWGEEYSGATELLRSVVRNLRRKIGDDARSPRFIFTEAQVGYRMPKASA